MDGLIVKHVEANAVVQVDAFSRHFPREKTSKITKTSVNTAVFGPKIKHITSKILVKGLIARGNLQVLFIYCKT